MHRESWRRHPHDRGNFEDLSKTYGVYERINQWMRLVGLNRDIETAQSSEAMRLFTSVTRDIRMLSESMQERLTGVGEELKTASRDHRAKESPLRTRLESLDQSIDSAGRSLNVTLDHVEACMDTIMEAVERVERNSGDEARHGTVWHEKDFRKALESIFDHILRLPSHKLKLSRDETGSPLAVLYDCARCERRGENACAPPRHARRYPADRKASESLEPEGIPEIRRIRALPIHGGAQAPAKDALRLFS